MNTRFVTAAAVCALPLAVQAQQVQILGSMSNFDVTNFTSGLVNDFKVTIVGGNAGSIVGTYTNPTYGGGQVMQMGANTMVTWGPNPTFTQQGQTQHFGVRFAGNPVQPATVCFDWTLNGVIVTSGTDPNMPQQTWDPVLMRVVDRIRNTTWRQPQNMWVQRRVNRLEREVLLEELVQGSPVVLTSLLIDPVPVLMAPDSDLLFNDPLFEAGAGISSFIVWYDVWEDAGGAPGLNIGTMYNAAVVPTPGAASLVLCAGIAATRRRRR